MILLKRALLLSTLCIASSSGLAQATTHTQCPSAEAIKKNDIHQVLEYLPGLYMGMEENNFDTKAQWRFNIGPMMGRNEKEAIKNSNEALKALSGPISKTHADGEVLCVYKTISPSNTAIATPLHDE